MPTFLVIVSLVWIAFYLYEVRKVKWTTSLVVQTAMFVALSFVLSMIKFYHYPQGGSLSLASMLPLMLCGILYGPGVGMTAGVASGLLKLNDGLLRYSSGAVNAGLFFAEYDVWFKRDVWHHGQNPSGIGRTGLLGAVSIL